MSTEYGRLIVRNARPYRSMRDAGLHNDLRSAKWAESQDRIDRWITWMVLAALPLLAVQMFWGI